MSREKVIPLAILFLCAILFCWHIFMNPSFWPTVGYHDSDEIISQLFLERQSIIKYGQFPLWSPALSGGMPFCRLTTMCLSPFFVLVLLFGEIIGVKLWIVLQLFFGLWGMHLLVRHLGCGKISSYLPGFIFFFSSFYPLIIAEGLYYALSVAWIPWVFLYYLKSFQNFRYIWITALFGTLIVFGGGGYPILFLVMFFLGVYSLIQSVQRRCFQPLARFACTLGLVLLGSAVQLLPSLKMLMEYHVYTPLGQFTDLRVLFNALFSRNQLLSYPRAQVWGLPYEVSFWEQRGAYIGMFVFLIYVFGVLRSLKKYSALVLTGLFFLLFSIQPMLPVPLANALKVPLIEIFFHVPSRYLWMFVLSVALISGLAIADIESWSRRRKNQIVRCIPLLVLVGVGINAVLVNAPVLKEAFTRSPQQTSSQPHFVQRKIDNVFEQSKMYPTVLSNQGICLDIFGGYYDGIYLCNAHPQESANYRGEAYIQKRGNGDVEIVYFSPHKVQLKVAVKESDVLIMNQNFNYDWKVKGLLDNAVFPTDGLVSARISPKDRGVVTFYYSSPTLLIGFFITLLVVIVGVAYQRKVMSLRVCTIVVSVLLLALGGSVLFVAYRYSAREGSFNAQVTDAVRAKQLYESGEYVQAEALARKASVDFPNSVAVRDLLKKTQDVRTRQEHR